MNDAVARLTAALADRYAIERELGAGGMATVYLAHDVRHDRKVALKVLRPELAAILGADRFLAEIKTTANLQHPHILSLFDSGEADGLVFYVMPFVEGESLRDRLKREHQLPVEEAVRITREVADALTYAHGHGIVHRDIKPENILLHGGHALVADFGIALAASRSEGGTRMTETGMSLGTPHYMAPEQAMGEKEITPKADVYALGCVLYEMLSGEPPFTGATAQAIIARVMTEEPRSLTLQRKTVPPHVEAAVEMALSKLPADRFASAAQFADALVHPESMPAGTATRVLPAAKGGARGWRQRLPRIAPWALFGLAALSALWQWRRPVPAPVSRYSIALPEEQAMQGGQGPRLAMSPDGARFVYVGPGEGGGRLWIRDRDRLDARAIAGTEGAISPFFSPDGQRIGFYTVTPLRLKVVSLTGEPPVTVADSSIDWDGGAWGPDGYIYSDGPTGLVRVRPGGGLIDQVTRFDSSRKEIAHNYPDVLPNGRGAVFTIWYAAGNIMEHDIAVVDFRSGSHHVLVRGVYARYVPGGYLAYVTADGTLLVAPFDQRRLRLTGPGTALAEGINIRTFGYVDLAVSATGSLVYLGGGVSGAAYDLVFIRRNGNVEVVDSGAFDAPVLSPDGRLLAVTVSERGDQQIWVRALPAGPMSKLTFESSSSRPAWTADGRSVTYSSTRAGAPQLYTQRADGSAPAFLQLRRPREVREVQWSRDGRWLVYREGAMPGTDILAVQPGRDTTPLPIVATQFAERSPTLSPDAGWLAYTSDESGQSEVYVRPFPDAARAKWQVSLHGGSEPLWAHSGRELFYRDATGALVAAAITSLPTFSVGKQTVLFPGSALAVDDSHREYDVSADDQRFLFVRERGGGERAQLIVVENWVAELKQKVARP